MKLTAKTITGLGLPRGKTDVIHFDDTLPGFGLRLRTGSDRLLRSWICQFRIDGKSRRFLIGSADTVAVDQARAAAKKVLAKVALGTNPQAEKSARRRKDAHSFRSVVDDYLAARKRKSAAAPSQRPRATFAAHISNRCTPCRSIGLPGGTWPAA